MHSQLYSVKISRSCEEIKVRTVHQRVKSVAEYGCLYVNIYAFRVKEQTNILHAIQKWKANWIGHILRRNYLLKQVIEGKIKGEIEVTRGQGRRRKKLLDNLKDRRGYCHLKEEALGHNMWRNRFGRGFELVRQTAG